MKKTVATALASTLVLQAMLPTVVKGEETDDMWKLTFEDTFEGTTLDKSKWSIDQGNGFYDDNGNWVPGWGNEELQSYEEDNVIVKDGMLHLEGREETVSNDKGTYNFTSGKIHSQGNFSQKYGRFEASMSLPEGQGYWPAFWMMPEDDKYGGWAASGEIDIMEAAGGRPSHIGGAIHYGGQWPNNRFTAKDYYFPEGIDITDFNEYAVEWEPGEIRWYVNDELFQTLNNWSSENANNAANFSYPAPFDQEFHLILNLAIGGWYGGNPDETTEFNQAVKVDYVRAYEMDEYREPVEPISEPSELPENTKQPVDGNYLYDPSFDGDISSIRTPADLESSFSEDGWNFVYLEEFGADATFSQGEDGVTIDASASGSQPYSIQLIQNATVGEGRWYRLSFDAKAEAARTLNVKVGAGPERGYTAYSPTRDFQVGTDSARYELVFQMTNETDPRARVELNAGLSTVPVTIDNVVLEEVDAVDPYNEDAPKTAIAGNHIYNGTFDQGRMDRTTFWQFESDVATGVVPEDTRRFTYTFDGAGEAELMQPGLVLPAGDYTLAFNTMSDASAPISVSVTGENGVELVNESVTAPTSAQDHEVTFTLDSAVDAAALTFVATASGSIDNVSLMREGAEEEEAAGERFPLLNGSFETDEHWFSHVQGQFDGTSQADVTVGNGKAELAIGDVGQNPWDIQLFQENVALKAGETYTLTFDVASTVDRTIEAVIENASYERYLSEEVAVTAAGETVSFTFDMPISDTTAVKFLAGNVDGEVAPHTLTFENVSLEMHVEESDGVSFSDFDESHASYEEVAELLERGIVKGFGDGTMRPGQSITRMEAAILLTRVLELAPGNDTEAFMDVPLDHPSLDYVLAVREAGIFSGSPFNQFFPKRELVRGEAAAIVLRAFGVPYSTDFTRGENDDTFSHEVQSLVEAELMIGRGNGDLAVRSSITRLEFLLLLARADKM
ncbi:carbohydrate binding domain-containing protein [Paenalkalicoccus suaedae]|uniref:Carbohydrate binding domain-containing protein n=1 Tax=Paenalkalicoccus suaedae TaxID=2592382 RepID=A0A859FGW5_9BACI|nr:carbohydrate binding domain-containing protein [Paenalkalicoccus suaedae]QKS72369.1 carbohydrate binding domain-containing protein [Paenalkalicoccus suaedae]